MTWFVQVSDIPRERVDAELRAHTPDDLDTEAAEQFEKAIKIAEQIVAARVVGESNVHVTISGHSNPGHAAQPDADNDSINVSVTSAAVYVPPPEPEPAPE